MKAGKTHILLVAAFLVAGCAATESVTNYLDAYTPSPTCNTPQCNYTIEVTACSESGIRPNHNPIHIGKGTHRIHWVITSPSYNFDTSGIAFPGNPGEFTSGTRVTPKEFSWTDNNPTGSAAKTHKYEIKVVDSSGRTCIHDPSIVNE